MEKAFLIRSWDSMASGGGDWDNDAIAMTIEAAEKEKLRMEALGFRVSVVPLMVVK